MPAIDYWISYQKSQSEAYLETRIARGALLDRSHGSHPIERAVLLDGC
jgi:hypothetical protein